MKEKKTEVITFRTTSRVKQYLAEEAERRGWSVSQLAEWVVAAYAEQDEKLARGNMINNQTITVKIN